MRAKADICFLISLVLALSSCQYVISPAHAPMAVIGAYEVTHKRERLLEHAKQGDVYAQYDLAESYRKGMPEGEINGAEAMKWYCEAARNGYAEAQVKLGQLYEQTLTVSHLEVTKDIPRAYMWYKMAQRRVSEDARTRLAELEPVMTPQELRDGNYLLRAPRQVPCGPEPLPWRDPKKKG